MSLRQTPVTVLNNNLLNLSSYVSSLNLASFLPISVFNNYSSINAISLVPAYLCNQSTVYFNSTIYVSSAQTAFLNVGSENIITGPIVGAAVGTSNLNYVTGGFATGSCNILTGGSYSFAQGFNNIVTGANSVAFGLSTNVSGNNSYADGFLTRVTGSNAHAEGWSTLASGIASHAEGLSNVASGTGSHVEGASNIARGNFSHVEGRANIVDASGAHAEGLLNIISSGGANAHVEGFSNFINASNAHAEGSFNIISSGAVNAHVEGYLNRVTACNAHAEGWSTLAAGVASHAEGVSTAVFGIGSHVEGFQNINYGWYSHVEGVSNVISNSSLYCHVEGLFNIISTISTRAADYNHVEGACNIVAGFICHVEGVSNIVFSSINHVEGTSNRVTGSICHAEGRRNFTDGYCCHVEGEGCIATGLCSHAEGFNTRASGNFSHSEGLNTIASGNVSHSQNESNTASGNWSYVCGASNLGSGNLSAILSGQQHIASNSNCVILGGYCNLPRAAYTTTTGQFARPRHPSAFAYASGAFPGSTVTAYGGAGADFPKGSAQTVWLNMIATTSTLANENAPFVVFNSDSLTPDTENISTNRLGVYTEAYTVSANRFIQYYYMQNIDMKITGYERKYNSGGGTGEGFFYGKYNFFVYWDNTPSQTLYLYDFSGANSVSPNSNELSTTFLVNRLTGNPTITVSAQVSTTLRPVFDASSGANPAEGTFAININSSGTNPTNWMAELKISEMVQATSAGLTFS